MHGRKSVGSESIVPPHGFEACNAWGCLQLVINIISHMTLQDVPPWSLIFGHMNDELENAKQKIEYQKKMLYDYNAALHSLAVVVVWYVLHQHIPADVLEPSGFAISPSVVDVWMRSCCRERPHMTDVFISQHKQITTVLSASREAYLVRTSGVHT